MVYCSHYLIYLHDFRYEGGAPINSGSQIPRVNVQKRTFSTNKNIYPFIYSSENNPSKTLTLLSDPISKAGHDLDYSAGLSAIEHPALSPAV